MRISWLSAEEIAAARRALKAEGASWDDHFGPDFSSPAEPPGLQHFDWAGITEHVARAERVSEVVREQGLEAAMARFGGTGVAIEAATLAAAAHLDEALELDQVIGVLRCEIDNYVFYAPFLELMIDLGREDVTGTVKTYEEFADAYALALTRVPHGLGDATAYASRPSAPDNDAAENEQGLQLQALLPKNWVTKNGQRSRTST